MLVGPDVTANVSSQGYGGGVGGYTRNMISYLDFFKSNDFEHLPCFHTIKGQLRIDLKIVRIFLDLFRFLSGLIKGVDLVHVLAQYRNATPREYLFCVFSLLMGKQYIYEIKAGAFKNWYFSTSLIYRSFIKFIIRNAKVILVEGKDYVKFVSDEFGRDAHYFPNCVPTREIPNMVASKLDGNELIVLFVGYCYRDKGVFDLVEGCVQAAKFGIPLRLELVGLEELSFKKWLEDLTVPTNLKIKRNGRLDYGDVMRHYSNSDIYCYPTYHSGEGHNNSVNEAMMYGLTIITTRNGFLSDVLGDNCAFFLSEISAEEISSALLYFYKNREAGKRLGRNARLRLLSNFTSDIVYPKLERYYEEALS